MIEKTICPSSPEKGRDGEHDVRARATVSVPCLTGGVQENLHRCHRVLMVPVLRRASATVPSPLCRFEDQHAAGSVSDLAIHDHLDGDIECDRDRADDLGGVLIGFREAELLY